MDKLTKTFDKMGFATDSYLGFLTVSPANLGTGMSFKATMVLEGKKRTSEEVEMIQQILNERLILGKGMKLDIVPESSESDKIEGLISSLQITFETGQTLAPNYNEMIQIDDFLCAIQTVGEFDQGTGDLSKTLENEQEEIKEQEL